MSQFQIILLSGCLIILIILGSFFSCAETGLMTVNRYRLRHLARMKKRYAMHILQLLKRPDRLLGAILIGNTFANMLASSLATLIAFHFWGDKGALLSAIGLTFIVLIIGEIAPKTVAAIYPEKIARLVVYPINFILRLLYPIVWLVNNITNTLLRLFGISVGQREIEPLSREELRSVVYDSGGKISRQYQNMLLSILDLSELHVADVMVPRHEIIGIDIEQAWSTIEQKIKKIQQDWVPVYKANVNNMIGVVYTREILRLLLAHGELDKEMFLQLMQEPYFVPENTSLNVQLGYFQQSRDKIAFVVDEYGEILGLLTLHDILEEIVGNITPSMKLEKRIKHQTDGSYLVEGGTTVREFNRETGWSLPLSGANTISGLIIENLQALPHPETALLIAKYPIEIIKVEENRVTLARIFQRMEKKRKTEDKRRK